jgi:SAM-dependent methyltransferase
MTDTDTRDRLSATDADQLRTFERQRHDSLASTYRDFFTPITALAIPPLLAAAGTGPGSRLLDVATGPGSVAAEANRLGARSIGIDLSPGMIALATASHPGIDFRVGDVEHLPFADQSLDAIVCNFGIGHFPWPEAALAECIRTLKAGGRIALSWWDQPDKQRIQGLFRDAIAEVGAAPPPDVPSGHSNLRFSDAAAFRNLLDGAGLADIRVEDHSSIYTVADVDTLWRGGLGSLAVTASAISCQDEATQRVIRDALERRATAYRTPAGLELPVAFRIGSGRKA